MQILNSQSGSQTKKFAGELMARLIGGRAARPLVLALQGDLGAGKTTFAQGLAKSLGINERITSPTFVLIRRFKIQDSRFKNFYHFDCYRIDKHEEILALGWLEIVDNPENIVVVEWPEKIKKLLPKNTIWLKFEYKDKSKRKIKLASL